MKHHLVEHWSYKSTWHDLSQIEREAFAARIAEAVQKMTGAGIRTLGFGRVDHTLDKAHKGFDFWSIWEMESLEARDAFLAGVAATGWYDYFEHANTGGLLQSPEKLIAEHVLSQ